MEAQSKVTETETVEDTEVSDDEAVEGVSESAASAMGECLQWACSPRGGNNFFGRVLNGCGKRARPGMNGAGVLIDSHGKYWMDWDPEWFLAQDPAFRLMIIVHEAAHLVLGHVERMLFIVNKLGDEAKRKRIWPVLNVAADLAANDIAVRTMVEDQRKSFKDHKDIICWPEQKGYPLGLTFEEYLDMLLRDLKKDGYDPNEEPQMLTMEQLQQMAGDQDPNDPNQDGGAQGPGGGQQRGEEDGQPQWFKNLLSKTYGIPSPEDMFRDMTEAEIDRAIQRANKEAQKIAGNALEQTDKSCGNVPSKIRQAVEDLMEEPTIPWQEIFKAMVKSEISSKLEESVASPNASLFHLEDEGVEPYPGYQHQFSTNILVGADTSGSVSDKEFKEFLQEIAGMVKGEDNCEIRLVMFDAGLQHECIVDETSINDSREFGYRYGYGGTSFTEFLKYANGVDTEEDWLDDAVRPDTPMGRPDLAIIFTDGYAPIGPDQGGPIPEFLPPFPLIWALTPSGREDPYMQPRVVQITESDE